MLQIVGVHGIRQGAGATTERLSSSWQTTIDGVLATASPDVPRVAVTVPSYQAVFPRTPTRFIRLGGPETDSFSQDRPIGEDEEAFILEALAAYAPSAAEETSPEAGMTLGGGPLTPRIVSRIQAVDRKVGKGVTDRFLWLVREAYTYLRHEETADAVRAEVAGVLAQTGARTVIAHSLGSVVAYDLISRGEAPDVTTLVTCGSPLSWLVGRKGNHSEGKPLSVPAGVEWTNLYAPKDYVTGCAGLSRLATGVTDIAVRTGSSFPSSHDVHRYLDTPAMASLIVKSSTA
ncbi:hypothetical protein ACFWXO_38470 [Kitasatospora sp. NPDC059088]|uniref:hypothetical protein n=1 Tax=Kitasatospora sp. NPDC059088 TaxID=3346722 RepID=UPI0036916709